MLDSLFATNYQTLTGQLGGIYPTAEGQNYTTATVNFAISGTGAVAPTASVNLAGGKCTHYNVLTPGSGMKTCVATISGDGSGATGNAYLTDDYAGSFSNSHAGWEAAEIFNAYALLVNGPPAGGIVNHTLTASANDLTAFNGMIAFYQRTARSSRPSMLTASWIPLHEYRVDPYHNGAGIENPFIKDTHAKGAMWTETIAPTLFASVEYGRYSGDWSWLNALYSLVKELTGTTGSTVMNVFPTFQGITWDISKTPTFNTTTHRSASGYEVRNALMQYPLWKFSLAFELLADSSSSGSDLKTLVGFFNKCQGSFAAFYYTDPTDNAVTAQTFGTGNGSTLSFQLTRTYGGFTEPVQNLNAAPSIYVNGVLQTLITNYSISPTGMVTFVTAPAGSAVLTWTGTFYYRVRFVNDTAEFNQFMYNLYELKQLEFIGSVINKV